MPPAYRAQSLRVYNPYQDNSQTLLTGLGLFNCNETRHDKTI